MWLLLVWRHLHLNLCLRNQCLLIDCLLGHLLVNLLHLQLWHGSHASTHNVVVLLHDVCIINRCILLIIIYNGLVWVLVLVLINHFIIPFHTFFALFGAISTTIFAISTTIFAALTASSAAFAHIFAALLANVTQTSTTIFARSAAIAQFIFKHKTSQTNKTGEHNARNYYTCNTS